MSANKLTRDNNVVLSMVSFYFLFALIAQQHLIEIIIGSVEKVSTVFFIILGFLLIAKVYKRFKVNFVLLILLGLMMMVMVSSLFIHHKFFLGAFFSIFVSYAICVLLSREIKKNTWILLFPSSLYVLFIAWRILDGNFNPDHIFLNSGNWISFYLVLTIVPYYYVGYLNKLEVSTLPALVIFLLSVYSHSRSGIAASFLVLLSVLFYTGISVRNVLIVFFGFMLSAVVFQSNVYDLRIERFDSLSNMTYEGGRAAIIEGTFKSFQLINYLFGFRIEDIQSQYHIETNLHNSYLNLVQTAGMIYGGIFVLLLFLSIPLIAVNNVSMALLLFAPLVRISSDSGALYGLFDASVLLSAYYGFVVHKQKSTSIRMDARIHSTRIFTEVKRPNSDFFQT